MLTNRRGFTAVEFAVGLAITGILGALAGTHLIAAAHGAKVVAMKADLHRLVIAEEVYFADSGKYTADLSNLDFQSAKQIASPKIDARPLGWAGTITAGGPVVSSRCAVAVNDDNPIASSTADGQTACGR